MALPLYKEANVRPPGRPQNGHAGLWFDKFCDGWENGDGRAFRWADKGKFEWLRKAAGSEPVGDRRQIDEYAVRRVRMVENRKGRLIAAKAVSRFVSGLGRSHPVENGFAWHPTLGVPYLPGSSVKGMVRAWAAVNADPQPDGERLKRLLGDPDSAGALAFLDAVPLAPVKVEVDVMTPHYGGWDESNPPGDWRSPTPIPFLVTACDPSPTFLFGIVPLQAVSEEELNAVAEWLQSALEWIGAGAKTAVGYGRMERDGAALERLRSLHARRREALEEARREAQRLAALSPLEREMEETEAEYRRRGHDGAAYMIWLAAVKDGRWSGDSEKEAGVLERVKAAMVEAGHWKPESKKKNPEKDRLYQRTLEVMKRLAELKGK